jgi:hypothetical protein
VKRTAHLKTFLSLQVGLQPLLSALAVGIVLVLLALFGRFLLTDKYELPILTAVADRKDLGNPNRLPSENIVVEGFYPTETNGTDSFRWTGARARLYLPQVAVPQKVQLEVIGAYPPGTPSPIVRILYNGQELTQQLLPNTWTTIEVQFPRLLELTTSSLEVVVDNPLPPRRDDRRVLGVAIKAGAVDVSKVAPPGLLLTIFGYGFALMLLLGWLGWSKQRGFVATLGSGILLIFYWYVEPFYATLLSGWIALIVALITLICLQPSRFFQPVARGYPALTYPKVLEKLPLALTKSAAFAVKTIPVAIISFFLFYIYGRSLDYGFFWDDYHIARPWTLEQVLGTLVGSWDPLNIEIPYYRPVTSATFALDWRIYDLSSWGYHMTNLLLYLLVTLLLYKFLRRIELHLLGALVAALLFIVMPNNVATANWISQRSDSLAVLFGLAGLLALDTYWRVTTTTLLGKQEHTQVSKARKGLWLALAYGGLVLALCSKEVAVAFAPIFVLYNWLRGGGLLLQSGSNNSVVQSMRLIIQAKIRQSWREVLIASLPAVGVLGFYFWWRNLVLPPVPPSPLEGIEYLKAVWFGYYSGVYQSFYRLDNLLSLQAAPWFTLSLLLLMSVGVLTLQASNGVRITFWLGLGWLLLGCLPLSLLGASYSVTARVLFLPEVGFAMLIGAFVAGLVELIKLWAGNWRMVIVGTILVLLIILPYNGLVETNWRAQKDYAPYSVNTLRWDKWVLDNWKGKILDVHYQFLQEKIRQNEQQAK